MPKKKPNREGLGNIFKPIPREENTVVMNSDLRTYSKRQMYKGRVTRASAKGHAKVK